MIPLSVDGRDCAKQQSVNVTGAEFLQIDHVFKGLSQALADSEPAVIFKEKRPARSEGADDFLIDQYAAGRMEVRTCDAAAKVDLHAVLDIGDAFTREGQSRQYFACV